MEILIELPEKGIAATYITERDDSISFTARLKFFSGQRPPVFIRFYKTEMGWSSAFEDSEIIEALGRGVDTQLQLF